MKKSTKEGLCLICGILCTALGCILIPVFHHMIRSDITKKLPLKPGSMSYKDWVTPPVPIYYSVWVFDLLNPTEVVSAGEKPYVRQRGPYTYREHREKFQIIFNNNSTVSYKERTRYVFDRDRSVGPETDTFTTANVAMMTIATMIKFEFNTIQELTELVLDAGGDSHLFSRYSVADILWGYEDPLLRKVNAILERYNKSIDDRIGIFYGQNNTDDGVYTVFTGKDDITKFAITDRWHGTKKLTYWTTDTCNMINGTDGTFFPPFVDQSETLYVFASDICRSLYLTFDRQYEERGIPLYSFLAPDTLFAKTEENAGFCTPYGNCQPAGLLNTTNCKKAPIFLSQPHFYAANKSVIKAIDGINPIPREHQTNIDVEPNTGIALKVDKKLQVNIYIEKVNNIRDTELIDYIYYPVLWLNESAHMNEKVANDINSAIVTPIKITQGVQYGLIIAGGGLSIAIILYIMVERFRRASYENMESADESN